MEKKKVVPELVSVILLILVGVFVFYNILWIGNGESNDTMVILKDACCILASVSACIYCLFGYSKKAALFMRIFGICMILYLEFGVASRSMLLGGDTRGAILFYSALVSFGAACVLNFSTDLGKKKSFCIVGILWASAVLDVILIASMLSGADLGKVFLAVLGKLLLVVIYGIMIYAKYKDKEARGTT